MSDNKDGLALTAEQVSQLLEQHPLSSESLMNLAGAVEIRAIHGISTAVPFRREDWRIVVGAKLVSEENREKRALYITRALVMIHLHQREETKGGLHNPHDPDNLLVIETEANRLLNELSPEQRHRLIAVGAPPAPDP